MFSNEKNERTNVFAPTKKEKYANFGQAHIQHARTHARAHTDCIPDVSRHIPTVDIPV